ncbi:hypothetical protein OPV22_025724 [Ensete ventricosum]|uniref:Uncharacterized protein n=1 Tax=Ensete ventricosum TaxID=4639 RepID=A0AAV8Q868_ENSVE|nr:hypothetical protein OPV22_025724 [Ensete ventricosum]
MWSVPFKENEYVQWLQSDKGKGRETVKIWVVTHLTADTNCSSRIQEIVPLNAGNIFGAEDSRPVVKWEDLDGNKTRINFVYE